MWKCSEMGINGNKYNKRIQGINMQANEIADVVREAELEDKYELPCVLG